MAVSPSQAARSLRERDELRRGVASRRADDLRALVPAAAEILRTSYGATRVVLFGSLVSGEPDVECDVDLAVANLAPDRYFSALADLFGHFKSAVDLVRLEEAPPSLVERIEAEGRES